MKPALIISEQASLPWYARNVAGKGEGEVVLDRSRSWADKGTDTTFHRLLA